MRYTQLRAFHFVAMHGGFSSAARALNLSQPSLSDHVRQLEQLHDTLLFHREKKHVRLTEAGDELFLLTRQFFDVEEQIGLCLSKRQHQLRGKLRVVADSALHITASLSAFRAANPKTFVSVRTGNSEDVLQRLRHYDAEIGVVGNSPSAPDLVEIPMGDAPIVAIMAQGFLPETVQELAFKQLVKWPLVFREKGSSTRRCIEAEAQACGLRLRPVIEVDGREALREVVASGAGIGFVSRAELGNASDIRAVAISGATLRMKESLVFLSIRR
ncbi:MAG: LysR substrate-binding domain-containing protein, partial [Paracoccaceae bacterium]